MSIRVNIERLVLNGVPAEVARRPELRAALEAELVRLLTADGLAPAMQSNGVWRHVEAGAMEPPASGTATDWGAAIARAVYSGIGGST